MNPKYIKRSLYSVSLFLMLGLGISLQIKAAIGQSMLNAFSLLVADLLNLEIGTFLNLLNLLFFIIYLIIRKSHLSRYDIIQIIATIANGYIINLFVYFILNNFVMETYFFRLVTFILGLSLASISLGGILAMEIIQFPLESLCLVLGKKLGHSLTVTRMRFDICFMITTIILTLITNHTLYIREGTIISFLLLSRLMGFSYYYHKKRI
jgi:Predicted membrane protein